MLVLQFNENRLAASYAGPEQFITEITGNIILVDDSDDESKIGEFTASLIDVRSATTESEDIYEIFDSSNQSFEYFEEFYDQTTYDFTEAVIQTAFGDNYIWDPNILVIERLVIFHDYRGRCFGLMALRALVSRLRSFACLIAGKPFPLQFEGRFTAGQEIEEFHRIGLAHFNTSKRQATKKLISYYELLGFKKLPKSPYMVLSSETPMPSLDSDTL